MTCTTTHYACDCVLERMKKLEVVYEAAQEINCSKIGTSCCMNGFDKLKEALKELES